MRLLSFLTTLLIAFLLAACGGGGGSPGLSSGATSNSTFSVAAPATLTLAVGSSQQYTIAGGVKPYTVFTDTPAIATGWLIGENVVAVGSLTAGTAKVTVRDSVGASFVISITVGSANPFFTTAPTALTIAPGPFASQTYKLGGGVPPYKAASSFPSIVSVVVNGTDVTITALQVPGSGNASGTITFTDSSATPQVLNTSVTLGAIPLAVAPTATTLVTGTTATYVITGGTPPYRFTLLDQCLTDVKIVNGNQLQVTAFEACTGSAVTIFDANNQTPTTGITFTITAGSLALTVNPAALTVPESATTPDLKLTVYGAKGGSIQVFTTNSAILAPVNPPVKNADGTYTITLAGGNTCSQTVTPAVAAFTDAGGVFHPAVPATGGDRSATITVIDALGSIGTSTVTVKDTNGVGGC